MPYVSRDSAGNINAVSLNAELHCLELIEQDNTELVEYLDSLNVGAKPQEMVTTKKGILVKSDLDLVRVMEDLINVLVDKNIICFTDLPDIAQQKINLRRNIRSSIETNNSLIDDDNGLI